MDAETLKSQFGRRVRSLRKQRDLTQEGLAEAAAMSPEYVSKIERGMASPSFDSIAHLARALDVSPREMFNFSMLSHRDK
jgi:transcriptional regulator with XRE-family HTH domain